MPSPAYPLPAALSPLHLYRHLLREATYLPPAFRDRIVVSICARFHQYHENDTRPKAHLERGMKVLRTLRAANSGDRKPMESLIEKSFGRSGRRRRELMAKFVRPQGPADSKALEAQLDGAQADVDPVSETGATSADGSPDTIQVKEPKKTFVDSWDQEKILNIMSSQMKQYKATKNTSTWPAREIRNVNEKQFAPGDNVWGKPPAEARVANSRAKWWKLSANKIMPPIGKGEWELLGRLSAGAQEENEWRIPERRPQAIAIHGAEDADSTTWDWAGYATQPTNVVERAASPSRQLLTGRKGSGPYAGRDRERTTSARWFRRAYNRTWQLTPRMNENPNTLQYEFQWGQSMASTAPPSKAQLEFLEGACRNAEKKGEKKDKKKHQPT